ncbi:Eco57I restriction-modification methylase domain-containing protein (plasmid) [Curtobacterium sp. TC1]|uniref:Eco57I restriction-modification methylase domain-containing protein n=1 Tax=Curtobacterium sp. TC1 TaxID=2862880 RepID=UPI001C9B3668|nr:Eco57I restriction-modification methylase domain-containing protein [Curtobacterium sp. TC1]QZQ53712.1 Eco57I restriction-modification methylase domain-containing protein [Curtobacterium sp. TC1]
MARTGTKAAAASTAAYRPDATTEMLTSLRSWWAHRAAHAGLSGRWLDPEHAVSGIAPAFDEAPGAADLHDRSGHELGQAYVQTLSPSSRAQHGQHYTPADLADHLWAQTRAALGWNSEDHRLPGLLRDPAAGSGALLLPPLREHLRAAAADDSALTLAALPQLIEGIDQDGHAAWVGSVILAAEMLPTLARVPDKHRRPLPALIRQGDGLDPALTPAAIAIMNPPYGRVSLDATTREQYAHVLYGHANIYGLFMAEGARNLTVDGVLSALVPTSFAAGLYQHRLRGYLSEQAPLRSVAFVLDRSGSFTGVLQETCLAVFHRQRHRKTTVSRVNGHIEPVASIAPPKGEGPWLIPRDPADAVTAAAAAQLPLTLSAAGYRASTGPLVWNRRREHIHARPGKARRVILWGADIDGGAVRCAPARNPQRYLALQNDRDIEVMTLTAPAVLVQRTTAPEQIRRLVPAELTSETLKELGGSVVIENHVNVLLPTTPNPLLSRGAVARILATRTLDRVMRCLSGTVAVSSYELAALPLPDAEVLATWEDLTGDELEAAVAKAYRLN